jgi:hypothetical protein
MSLASPRRSPLSERSYYLDLFTGTTWKEFLDAGASVSGFRESRWSRVQKISPGDYLLCYLTGLSRWIGVLEVTGAAYKDSTPVWAGESFPCRVPVRVVEALTPETAVPVLDMRNALSIFANLTNPNRWQGRLRGSPERWKPEDGQAVAAAVAEAKAKPVYRDVDKAKLARRPAVVSSSEVGDVTLPDREIEPVAVPGTEDVVPLVEAKAASAHTEAQWVLCRLGADMGLSVWAPRGDRGKEWDGRSVGSVRSMLADLPHQFDEATNRTIENIDVLWLEGNSIRAAFEVESTTSIYSGLLRMSDLVAMQPNLNIPLFIVAPDERRNKVIAEVNRPTFSRLKPPLVELCRFIPFSALKNHLEKAGPYVAYLKPDYLQVLSEPCETG